MTVKDLKSYQILNEKHVKELNSDGILLEHKKTGARVFLLSNDDENKVFCIGFRTPPSDSTGVPHIMEHSVLCGSAKFPVKDPFVELVKGSLNTFLNAMTYPDKTVYPVASCNDKDFQNLMDVYMDAVLHPNIYKEEKIFRQEGWHYEMESADSPITVNGVVYNEMKGAFSSPEGVLDRYTQNTLYPDICYTHESGGAPEVIPELTYEDFLNFHRKFYHPSNSFIYLYGNMDMEEKLRYLNPRTKLKENEKRLDELGAALERRMQAILEQKRHKLALLSGSLDGMSPLKKMAQGYSYVEDAGGHALTDAGTVQIGEALSIHLYQGSLKAAVTEICRQDVAADGSEKGRIDG